MFEALADRLEAVFKTLRGKGRLSEADIDGTLREIRLALLDADVALPVVRDFLSGVRERARSAELSRALNPAQQVISIVNEELIRILGGQARRLRFAKNPPTVILLAGLQGSGKTTVAAKLGRWLAKQGHTPVLVAADLQRPNAVEQLQVLGARAEVPVFAPEPGSGVGDPVDVARRGVEFARRRLHDIVVIDTAGRLGVDEDMMRQAMDIRDATEPDEILFVVDAMVGQDAVTTARAFLDGVGFDGVILTKLDGDARGGAALSVASVTGKQILFASTGEKLDDFDVFHPERMASRILGMGDVLTLIEQAQAAFDAEQAERAAQRITAGELTLDDFLEQMTAVRKMGPIANILGMLPGMGQFKDAIAHIDDRDLDRVTAIIRSMTPEERADPKILNGSRRARIARGSGTTVAEVNSLVERFFEARKMMKHFAGMGIPGMRRTTKATKSAKNKKGGKKKGGRPVATRPTAQGLPSGLGGLPGGVPGGLGGLRFPGGLGFPSRPGIPGGFGLPGGSGLPGLTLPGGSGPSDGAASPEAATRKPPIRRDSEDAD
ncbi:MAG: signal recognition particle protein [Acidothermus cellulolyticus]|nr:signal recognition particle protein [Acidothermus cellulolyticus]